jgi:hypothetical protein
LGKSKIRGLYFLCQKSTAGEQKVGKITFNVFLINYPCLTKYSIEKDSGVNHASKKGHCEGQT